MPLLCYLGMRIASKIGLLDDKPLLGRQLIQNGTNSSLLFTAPCLLPYIWLLTCGVLFIFTAVWSLCPLLFAIGGSTQFVDSTMMYNRLNPAMYTSMLLLIGACLTPDRQECLLYDIFGSRSIMKN